MANQRMSENAQPAQRLGRFDRFGPKKLVGGG
jgi:hypothetical protein